MAELVHSYTSLDMLSRCPMCYHLKYDEGLRTNEDTLSTRLGSLLHKAKEEISLALMRGDKPDYASIRKAVMEDGFMEENEGKPSEHLMSVQEIRQMYPIEWAEPDNKSGMTYDQKLEIFFSHLNEDEKDPLWYTIGVEVPFQFEYQPGVFIRGYIDKVQRNLDGGIRVVDYKTSKKVFDRSDLNTPLQLYIYTLACAYLYPGEEVVEWLYDFILLGQKAWAGSKGWLKRADAKLKKILAEQQQCNEEESWKPKPSPLCHWCPYCDTSLAPDKTYSKECRYYSEWTPEQKVFTVHVPYDAESHKKWKEMKTHTDEFVW